MTEQDQFDADRRFLKAALHNLPSYAATARMVAAALQRIRGKSAECTARGLDPAAVEAALQALAGACTPVADSAPGTAPEPQEA